LMFAVGRRIGTDGMARRAATHGTVIAAVTLGIYCMVELVWRAPVEFVSNSSRLGGPFGSAAYLGAASCLLLPVAIGVACDTDEVRSWRLVGAAGSLTLAIAVLGSGSRAALVALLVASVLVIVVRRRRSLPATTRRVVVASMFAAVVAVGVAIRTGVFERSAGLTSRLDEWRIATRAIADHAVTGVGPEGYRLVVGQFVDADYVRRFGESTGIDRAHSGVLDVAISSGVLAAVVYLALIGTVVWSALRSTRRANALDTGLAAAVIAYAVQQQLLFPLAELDPVFWMLAGIVVVRARPIAHSAIAVVPGRTTVRRRSVTTAAAVLLATSAAVAGVVGVRAVAADRLALDAANATDVALAIDRAEGATNRAPFDIRHLLLLARSHEQERSLSGVDRAIESVGDALDISPLEPTSLYEQARLLSLRAAITGTDDDRLAASAAWQRELERAPNCARCHVGEAMAAIERGNIEAARQALVVAADLGNDEAVALLERIGEE